MLPLFAEDNLRPSYNVLRLWKRMKSSIRWWLQTLPTFLTNLSKAQKQDILAVIHDFAMFFKDTPTQRTCYNTSFRSPIKQHAYRVNAIKRSVMKAEVEYLLKNDLAEPSFSPWRSPCLLVPKPDSTFRFLMDYRKVNSVTVQTAILSRMEDCALRST